MSIADPLERVDVLSVLLEWWLPNGICFGSQQKEVLILLVLYWKQFVYFMKSHTILLIYEQDNLFEMHFAVLYVHIDYNIEFSQIYIKTKPTWAVW